MVLIQPYVHYETLGLETCPRSLVRFAREARHTGLTPLFQVDICPRPIPPTKFNTQLMNNSKSLMSIAVGPLLTSIKCTLDGLGRRASTVAPPLGRAARRAAGNIRLFLPDRGSTPLPRTSPPSDFQISSVLAHRSCGSAPSGAFAP